MVKYRALISFSGNVTMTCGEVRDFNAVGQRALIKDLTKAGYIEKADAETPAPEADNEEEAEQ